MNLNPATTNDGKSPRIRVGWLALALCSLAVVAYSVLRCLTACMAGSAALGIASTEFLLDSLRFQSWCWAAASFISIAVSIGFLRRALRSRD
jgi:hypothetical protein